MKRLVTISIAFIFILSIHVICDWVYPGDNDKINESWDLLKHCLYLFGAGLCVLCVWFESDERYEKYVKLISLTLGMGVIVPMIMDKHSRNRHVYWFDFVCIGLAIYGGMRGIFPETHKKITLYIPFINEKRYNWLCQIFK